MISAVRSQFTKVATRLLLALAIFGIVGLNNAHAQTAWPAGGDANQLTGSWLTTYQIAVFGGNVPILFSFNGDGTLIESDSPLPNPFGGSIGTVILSNGHGAWKRTGEKTFAFTYKKQVFHTDGSSYGVVQTNGTVTLSSDGTKLQIDLTLLTLTDNQGNITFTTSGTGTATRIVVAQSN